MAKKQIKNLVSAAIPVANKTAVQTAIQTIAGKLPFLISLTNEERTGGIKMGDKSLPFVEKVVEYAKDHPTLLPGFTDFPEMVKDYMLSKDLTDILQWIRPLVQKLEDTAMEAGIEALWPALAFYQSVKSAAGRDVPGTKTIYTDLSKRFPGRAKRKEQALSVDLAK